MKLASLSLCILVLCLLSVSNAEDYEEEIRAFNDHFRPDTQKLVLTKSFIAHLEPELLVGSPGGVRYVKGLGTKAKAVLSFWTQPRRTSFTVHVLKDFESNFNSSRATVSLYRGKKGKFGKYITTLTGEWKNGQSSAVLIGTNAISKKQSRSILRRPKLHYILVSWTPPKLSDFVYGIRGQLE